MSIAQRTDRAERLVDLFPEAGIDVMLVTDLVNVRYLTGYTGSNGLALVGAQTRAFITDFRYVEQAAEQVDSSFVRHQAPLELLDAVHDLLPDGTLALGFESTHVTVRNSERLREVLPDRVSLVPVEGVVEQLRAVKEPDEVGRIREATKLADTALERVLADGLLGRTERQVALSLTNAMYELGASRPSFEAIVAGGSPRRAAARRPPRRSDRTGRARGDRLGRRARWVLLGLHPHRGNRRARRGGEGDLRARAGGPVGRPPRDPPRNQRSRGRRRGAEGDRRCRSCRSLRPRARARRRARDPRGAAPLAAIRGGTGAGQRRHRRTWGLPARCDSGCESRIWSS